MKKACLVVAGLALGLSGCGGGSDGGLNIGGGSGGNNGGATGLIAFRSVGAAAGDIFTIDAAGGTATNITNSAAEEQSPAVSPDRSQIAYYRRIGNNAATSELWIANADGSGQRKLADGAPSFEPDWSPDGTKIAFFGRNNALQVIGANGVGLQTLVASLPQNGEVSWTPDGTQLVFDGAGSNIQIVNANGSGQRVLISNARNPDISPDGNAILFTRNGGTFIQDADGSGTAISLVADGFDADFSPDGAYITYIARRGGGGGAEGGANLFVQPLIGGAETQLTSNGSALQPAWG